MALLSILQYPHPTLAKKSEPVSEFTESLKTLAKDMAETMYKAPGIGLAAPQVGRSIQLVVIDVTDEKNDLRVFVNPKVTVLDETPIVGEEGCLSLPDIYEKVSRPRKIQVDAQDLDGNPFTLVCEDLMAVCVQHEVDHLNGTVFIDHLSRLKKFRAAAKLAKMTKEKRRSKKHDA